LDTFDGLATCGTALNASPLVGDWDVPSQFRRRSVKAVIGAL
jgi:hypothetical protein